MKKLITSKETKAIDKIDAIDIKQNAYRIFENPTYFFNKHTKDLENPIAIIYSKFSILLILKRIDSNEELCELASDKFLNKYSVEKWIDTLLAFYAYMSSMIDFILENHNNYILDAYNNVEMSKKTMKESMKSFVGLKKQLLLDKQQIEECVNELEKDKKEYKEEN